MDPDNCYEDAARAGAYAKLEFAGTYHLAYRDLPKIFRAHAKGDRALDFGCGTGRSTRFLRRHGFAAVGVDVSADMIRHARELDPDGDYRRVGDGDFAALEGARFDLALSMFTFDNIPGMERKVRIFRALAGLLQPTGRIVSVVSSPEIYVNEWASFSTRDYPENARAKSGDTVRIVITDTEDPRPVEDTVWSDESYDETYRRAGLRVLAKHRPLARGDEPFRWVSETRIAPWVIYVLEPR
ncbi:MAG TPA: class I SAM-dependent methyltransferase [Terriglobales bacterium]|nr:class I SAM-dependent methyltransferase [Terriglobales bacterium]